MFPYLRISSLFWYVFCFNECRKETLHYDSPGLPDRWMTYLFWEAGRKAHAVIPSLDHTHTYCENIVQPLAHTQSRLLPKVLDQRHTHRSTATHTDACTDVLPVYRHLRRSWKGRSWQWITTTGAIHEYLDREQDELLLNHPCTHPVPLSPVLSFRIWQ